MRVLGFLAALSLIAGSAAGCQPLYGNKPDKLKAPEKKKRPKEIAGENKIKYEEDCSQAKFFETPIRGMTPNYNQAMPLVANGNGSLESARKSKEPEDKVNQIISAIRNYSSALAKDPFNAEATMQLAVAYDMVLKKGCALALLTRLKGLQNHVPPNSDIARTKVDEVASNQSLFKGYRKDALAAVGR